MPSCLHVHHGLHHWPTCLHEQPGPQAPTFCTPAHITLFGRGPNEDLNAIMMRSASGECGHEAARIRPPGSPSTVADLSSVISATR